VSLSRAPFALLLASALTHSVAHAEEKCRMGDTDCEERAEKLNSEPESEAGEPRLINVSGLVPLKELNRRPYAGMWFIDLRFHAYEVGLSVLSLSLEGKVRGEFNNGQGVTAITEDVAGVNSYAGFMGSYYFPLLGYTPNVSVGLAPELHAVLGGIYSGSSSSALNDLSDKKIGTALLVPVFLMARIGGHASRYGDWPVSFGAGIGAGLITFNAGEPVVDSGSFVQPMLKFEVAYHAFKLGFATGLGRHDNFTSSDATVRLAYRPQLLTLSFVSQPDPED
jgi:hypothetical protein